MISFHLITLHSDTGFKECWSFFTGTAVCVQVCVSASVCASYRHIPRKLFQALGLCLMKARAWLQRAAIQSTCADVHTHTHTHTHTPSHTSKCTLSEHTSTSAGWNEWMCLNSISQSALVIWQHGLHKMTEWHRWISKNVKCVWVGVWTIKNKFGQNTWELNLSWNSGSPASKFSTLINV